MCPDVYLISCPVACCVPSPPLALVHTYTYWLCDLYTYIYRNTIYTTGHTLRTKYINPLYLLCSILETYYIICVLYKLLIPRGIVS